MGFFDWIMKGIGFESEEDEDLEVTTGREDKKEKEKKLRHEKRREKHMSKYQKDSKNDMNLNGFSSTGSYSSPMFKSDQSFGGNVNSSDDFGAGLSSSVGGYGSKNFVFFKPKNYEDVKSLVEFLRQGEPAIINLDDITSDEAQRTLDFVSGAVCALSGSIQRISGNIFLIAPDGYNITKSN